MTFCWFVHPQILTPRLLRISVAVALVLTCPGRTHRGGWRKQRRIQVHSRHTADPVSMLFPHFDLCVINHCAGSDFNNLISMCLSLCPKSTLADTLHVACSMQDQLMTLFREPRFLPSFQKWTFSFWLSPGFIHKATKWVFRPGIYGLLHLLLSAPIPWWWYSRLQWHSRQVSDFHLPVPVPPPVFRSHPQLTDFVSQLSAFYVCSQAPAQPEKQTNWCNVSW